jgi:hypothetical protein
MELLLTVGIFLGKFFWVNLWVNREKSPIFVFFGLLLGLQLQDKEGYRKEGWLRGVDLNHRPLGYEPNELPGCSTPQFENNRTLICGQIGGELRFDLDPYSRPPTIATLQTSASAAASFDRSVKSCCLELA